MSVFPTPFLGRDPIYRGEVNHVALSAVPTHLEASSTAALNLALSGDGEHWTPQRIGGDLARYTRSAGGPGAFELMGIVRFKGAWWAHGAIWQGPSQNIAGLFKTVNGRTWKRVLTGFEAAAPLMAYRHFRFGDANANFLVLLKELGEVVYSPDGVTWSFRDDVTGYDGPFGPSIGGRGLAVTTSGVAIVGPTSSSSNDRVMTAATPGGTFTDRGAPWGAKGVNLVRRGNIVLGASIYNPSLGAVRAAYAPAAAIGQAWGDAGLAEDITIEQAFFALNRWYAGSGANWRTSIGAAGVPGVGGWVPAAPPWAGSTLRVGYERDGKGFAHFGNGALAISDDGEDWDVVSNSGLNAVPYIAAAA